MMIHWGYLVLVCCGWLASLVCAGYCIAGGIERRLGPEPPRRRKRWRWVPDDPHCRSYQPKPECDDPRPPEELPLPKGDSAVVEPMSPFQKQVAPGVGGWLEGIGLIDKDTERRVTDEANDG